MVHDLNLLRALAALYRTSNVTRAARELGVSQSALSHSLARLREALGDPLFVRAARGVVPTPFALSIRAEVERLEVGTAALFRRRERFDPAEATGRVVVATTDYLEVVAGPRLLPLLAAEAPGLTVSFRPTGSALPTDALEGGLADLAVAGFYRELPEGFYASALLEDPMRAAVAAGRPVPADREAFLAARHALITLEGDFEDRLEDALGAPRRFAYGTSSFTAVAWAVASSDLVLTAPGRLLDRFAERFALTLFDPPARPPPVRLRMVWHGRTHADPLHAWFRDAVRRSV